MLWLFTYNYKQGKMYLSPWRWSFRNFYLSHSFHILHVHFSWQNLSHCIIICALASADPEGGPGVRTPPLRFVRGGRPGSCVEVWKVHVGGPTVVLALLLSIFSGSLRSPITYKHITWIHTGTSKVNVQYGTVIFFIFPLSKLWIESNFPSLAFYERAFSYFSSLE